MRARWRCVLVALGLLVLVAVGAGVRMSVARDDPGFDPRQPVGMLKSDPALLFYITERVVEAEGLFPTDLRDDPRVQHPRGTDLAREFTIGQELLVGWTYPRFAFGAPLHLHAQRVMALCASLFVVGVFLAARAARDGPGRDLPALGAAALAAVLPAGYRTMGWVLIREDLSLPLFAIGAGCAAMAARARADRRDGVAGDGAAGDGAAGDGAAARDTDRAELGWALAAGFVLAASAATWHAMTFVLGLLALALAATAALTGANPLGVRSGRIALAIVALAGLLVPALRASGFVASPPMVIALGLLVFSLLPADGSSAHGVSASGRGLRRAVGMTAAILGVGVGAWLIGRLGWSGQSEMSHVYEVILAKLRHLGVPPVDPRAISFDARLLWQGPFETLALGWGIQLLGLALPVGVVGALALLVIARRTGRDGAGTDPVIVALVVFLVLTLPAAWFVSRLVVLPALVLPIAACVGLARVQELRGTGNAVAWIAGLVVAQGALFARHAAEHEISWYGSDGIRRELQALVQAVPAHIPEDEAILADFVNSTALLAHTRRPIVLQPKYETEASRRDAEAFLTAFFHDSPAELAALMRERFRCRYLVVDRYTLGMLSDWTAGIPYDAGPVAGSVGARMVGQDADVLGNVEGFELLWRSPPTVLQSNGEPFDLYRIYRLAEE